MTLPDFSGEMPSLMVKREPTFHHTVVRWSDPGSDPLADIARMREQMYATSSYRPTQFIIRRSHLLRIMRGSMTKRRWRRIRHLY